MNLKRMITLMILCTVTLMCIGCKKKHDSVNLNLNSLQDEFMNCSEGWPQMEFVNSSNPDAEEMFIYLADFPYEKVKDYFFLYSLDSTRAGYEVAVICLKSDQDVKELKEALTKHVEYRIRTFESYAPDQVTLMERASIVVRDNYVALIVTDNHEQLKELFLNVK